MKVRIMSSSNHRFLAHKTSPALFQAMIKLAEEIGTAGNIAPQLRDLIESRVSQINRCSFCLRMHAQSFRDHGGDPAKLDMLAVWRAAKDFTPTERAVLDWAELLTRCAPAEEITASYRQLLDFFEDKAISELTFIVSTINAWNRLGIAQHKLA